jgi:formylglycine-generating enzyme required for sulfatase activity
MNFTALIAIVLIIAGTALDEPSPATPLQAVRSLEDAILKADEQLQSQRTAAKVVYKRQLTDALAAALTAKDLETANELDSAVKLLAMDKPFVAPRFQQAIDAERTYDDTLRTAVEEHQTALSAAENSCRQELQEALDAALAAKNLGQANNINAAIREIERRIALRNAAPPKPLSTFTNSVGIKFVWLPTGEFLMGSPTSDSLRTLDEVQHPVRLTRQIAMGVHEVTQTQYENVTGSNPSRFRGANHPVDTVSWNDAVAFCDLLSSAPAEKAAGRKYRLPTEAEWEYACRAGTSMAYCFGNEPSRLARYAWFQGTSNTTTHAVGLKQANRWGLYDMHGNVWEWCHDWYGPYSPGTSVDPTGPESGTDRSVRGGGFFFSPADLRSARRLHGPPENRDENGSGFRVVVEVGG